MKGKIKKIRIKNRTYTVKYIRFFGNFLEKRVSKEEYKFFKTRYHFLNFKNSIRFAVLRCNDKALIKDFFYPESFIEIKKDKLKFFLPMIDLYIESSTKPKFMKNLKYYDIQTFYRDLCLLKKNLSFKSDERNAKNERMRLCVRDSIEKCLTKSLLRESFSDFLSPTKSLNFFSV